VSAWETIENTIVQTLSALTLSGQPLLSTVKAVTSRDRKVLSETIQRERMPVAYVMAVGREDGDKASRRAGFPAFSVLLGSRSHRSDDDARGDGAGVAGVFTISEAVIAALQDLLISSDRRLLLVDERPFGGESGTMLWEQRYELRRQSELVAPTFGGVALAGAISFVQVELGSLHLAVSSFSFPGIDGVFQRHLGVRERPIVWRGQLRAANDSALNTIETAIEDELRGGVEKTMVDAWGRSHELCVMKAFHRRGVRRRDELSGQALQDFEIEFAQLGR
jgi:hypothetical protein